MIKNDGIYRMVGALTINTGGSVSFFPDMYNLNAHHLNSLGTITHRTPVLDHYTLTKDFLRTKAHGTAILDRKRNKILSHRTTQLDDGDHHWLSISISDLSFLNDVPSTKDINLLNVQPTEENRTIVIESLKHSHKGLFSLPEQIKPGIIGCMQLIIREKYGGQKEGRFWSGPFKNSLFKNIEEVSSVLTAERLIETSDNHAYDVIVRVFTLRGYCDYPLVILRQEDI